MIGKPYSGKPNVRFDEGELEIEPFGNYANFLFYCKKAYLTILIYLFQEEVLTEFTYKSAHLQ